MKHIPGPWTVVWNEATNRATIKKESDKRSVCSITPNNWDDANAKLIAAAPEMLEAMLEFCNRVEKGEVRSTYTYTKFKAIIKAATE